MTHLLYLQDTYLFEEKAIVKDIQEQDGRIAFILNQTIFYPQGGGQPADHGQIIGDMGVFNITDVRLDKEGVVWHYGEYESGECKVGDEVVLKLDKERRILHARIHSAGHLLDCAVEKMNISDLEPTKGYHFPEGPYIEYKGHIENTSDLIPELERIVNELVEQDIPSTKKDLSYEEAEKCGIWAPPGKSARIVSFKGFSACGCGGTHVNSASQVCNITVRKIKSKTGIVKISYSIEM